MCDYGCGKSIPTTQLKEILDAAFSSAIMPVKELLIGTCGSILDKNEIMPELFRAVLDYIKPMRIKTLIFETHYTTITQDALRELKSELGSYCEEIVIEMGLESSDNFVLANCWNKSINLSQLEETVRLIKGFGFGVVLNVMSGAPFLTPAQQFNDTLEAVKYAVRIGADRTDIFPVNIKKNTVIGYLYGIGKYTRPSLWMLAEILRTITDDCLGKIEFSWFGDRQKNGVAVDAIPPASCDICSLKLHQLLEMVMGTFDAKKRRSIIDSFFVGQPRHCNCYATFLDSLSYEDLYCESNVFSKINELVKELL